MTADYDSPWKEALELYFEPFLALLFPAAHAGVDWSRGFESLDKEFQQVVREAELGRRFVDKLFKVWVGNGTEYWILIHIEVQTTHDGNFPERMYVYNYRIFDRYNKPVASFAVRGLFERGLSAKDVRELFRLIDWIMVLPRPLESKFQQDVEKYQEEKRMPYISTAERVGERRGMRVGIESLLKKCFGEQGLTLMPKIEQIHYEGRLRAIIKALETGLSFDELRELAVPRHEEEYAMPDDC